MKKSVISTAGTSKTKAFSNPPDPVRKVVGSPGRGDGNPFPHPRDSQGPAPWPRAKGSK